MPLSFLIVYSIWLITEILVGRILRSASTDKKHTDKNSLLTIWVGIIISTSIAIAIAKTYYLPIFKNGQFVYLGLVLIVMGIILRFIAIYSLGRFFTVDITIRKDHALKKDGMYKYFRHPSYTASLLSFIGFGISLNNWVSLLIVTATVITVFLRRIKLEEELLLGQFGSAYTDYKKTTSGLIPFIH